MRAEDGDCLVKDMYEILHALKDQLKERDDREPPAENLPAVEDVARRFGGDTFDTTDMTGLAGEKFADVVVRLGGRATDYHPTVKHMVAFISGVTGLFDVTPALTAAETEGAAFLCSKVHG